MKLIIQPDAGIAPILSAIQRAKKSIHIVIFRFDLGGVVNRTEDDLVRYHGKVLIVDRRRAYILGFNYTKADLKSRSFGVMTQSHRIVKELVRLFDSDANRTPYVPRVRDLVVSPENARRRLESFIRKARSRIDIYDPQVSDDGMLDLLSRRVAKGVDVRILGKLESKWAKAGINARPFPGGRLHVRAIIRDGERAFVGSQSLRRLELDGRREVGLIVRDRSTVRSLQKIFQSDWKKTKPASVKPAGRAKGRDAAA